MYRRLISKILRVTCIKSVLEPFLGEVQTTVKINGYSEGYLKAQGYWIFFKTFGEAKKGTILCLHGGPGGSHDSGVWMARFCKAGYKVVLYDQLGCGKSDLPQDHLLYTVERYVEEVEAVRAGLELGEIHLYGSSWGGFLNVAYGIKYSSNLRSLLVSSGSSSGPLCAEEFEKLRAELPKPLQKTLSKFEAVGDYFNDEYLMAVDQVYKRHLLRSDPWPRQIQPSVERKRRGFPGLVYRLMWGPNEFTLVGTLRYWDVTSQLDRINVPTLITCGRYDEITPKNSEVLNKGIKNSEFVMFEKSAHAARLEEPEKYFRVYNGFLDKVS